MKWDVSLIKTNGEIRKQFSSWLIPTKIREKHSINDGMICTIMLKFGDLEVTKNYKITSGGEFRIPNPISSKIKLIVEKSTSKRISFTIGLASNIQSQFENAVARSLKDSRSNRQKRLGRASKKITANVITTVVFIRNPDVVAEVLFQAKGICEMCHQQAPFNRKSNGSPFLEIHHKIRLADGGEDTVKNAIALCPNCHRKMHFG